MSEGHSDTHDGTPWQTAITEIGPNSIRVRGYAIEDLMGRASVGQVVYLVLRGELPSPKVGLLLDAVLVACVDHGATPPSTLAARTAASTGAPLNAALAVGLLSINAHHGGAIENCMRVLESIQQTSRERHASTATIIAEVVNTHRTEGKHLPGFGHRLHTADPRTTRLLELSSEAGLQGDYLEIGRSLEKALAESTGKKLPLNVDGAIAAILCELGFSPELANGFFMLARVPGLVAHIIEEGSRQTPMRQIHPTHHEYDGMQQRSLT